jgi:hypothetical protein
VAAKTVIVKQMAAHMEEFRALTLACNQKELEKRLLYLQVGCCGSGSGGLFEGSGSTVPQFWILIRVEIRIQCC